VPYEPLYRHNISIQTVPYEPLYRHNISIQTVPSEPLYRHNISIQPVPYEPLYRHNICIHQQKKYFKKSRKTSIFVRIFQNAVEVQMESITESNARRANILTTNSTIPCSAGSFGYKS
jgi:hypothetical protein